MSTQKTGIDPKTSQATPQQDTAVGESINIGGRDIQRIDMRNTLHKAMEGAEPGTNAMNPGVPRPDDATKEEVDRAIPDFLRQQEQTAAEPNAIQGLSSEQSEMANLLAQRIVEASSDGREEAAKELKDLLGKMMGELEPKRIRTRKEAHPALQKLRRNLGLQRISPATTEWCGTKWHFAAPPPALDRWVAQMVEQGLGSYSALKLAAAIVGLDDVPIYNVFGVEIRAEFAPPDGSEPIKVRLYEKRCDACGETIEVDAEECVSCGSLHDPFTVPLNLRVRCAELMNRHFAEEFGPYEDLRQLHTKMREQMPDRTVDKEKLYPFPELLPTSSSEMDTTPSGEKPSSD